MLEHGLQQGLSLARVGSPMVMWLARVTLQNVKN